MLVSVVTPIFNRRSLTLACLRSLQRTCPPGLTHIVRRAPASGPVPEGLVPEMFPISTEPVEFEFLFVDNGSTDGSADALALAKKADPRVQVGRLDENKGFAIGSNEGLAAAKGELVVFLNNDTEAKREWFVPLVYRLLDPTVGAVGSLLWYPGRVPTVQHAGMVWTKAGPLPKVMHLYRHKQVGHEPGIRIAKDLQQVTGACLAMRTTDARKLAGFDSSYRNSYEDLDLCFRVRFELGLRVVYEPASELVHHESQTAGRSLFEAENERLFLTRWGDRIEIDAARVMAADRYGGAS